MIVSLFNRRALSLAVLSLLASSAAANVFESLSAVPQGWRYSRTPRADQPMKLQIALAQGDTAGFEAAVMDMSTPDHPSYGNHFNTHEEMKRMLQPSAESVGSIREWLEGAGITRIEQDADWLTFYTTVEKANKLLAADFQFYANSVKHIERLRTLKYSVPKALESHINMIQPTTRFGQLRANRAILHTQVKETDAAFRTNAMSASPDCNSVITPQCLKEMYNIGDYKASDSNGNKVGFASYLEEYARYADLELFEKNIAPFAKGQNFTVVQYNGGGNDQHSPAESSEANLDLQYIVGVSSPVPVTEFSVGGRGELVPDLDQPDPNNNNNEPYLEFLQNVLKMDSKDLPQVISTSYGEDEQSVPEKYARTVCNLFSQLGSRGVSVIFSSGDSGVGAACQTNDGRNATHFPPQFPAACPWVTSVGATTHTAPEKAVYFSSGGFSDLWERPQWQEDAVTEYLDKLGDRWSGLFNPNGRAFPDVTAQGQNYAIYNRGALTSVDGTSCSAPAFAGVIALLNDARFKAKKAPMGFLNPWLYSTGRDGLNDIVDGGSTGCDGHGRFGGPANGGPSIPGASWNATEGWDPVSGLGSPNFGAMLKLADAE
ncbi:Peptidase S8/S53 subtilisin/kexin/sedolisin [Penicillium cf. griseofulvum]|uniref:tripeptidyl-peptidase II n=1 Tax=Penicillium cf. griseofulvum TaxID=2972120 RepID=A0A9W9J1G1_9EURO|nr:Peptidase S8/S53 subtilisin/kexin/sedolisin [Penicillium cf. griseofulvum]KAJ5434636.1 Peptidase S8/S53 subtilisin/kexin/sedolisin [Penicillium cf. griseofulvum]KAJ5452465.1 Peptidase S8/S53 subtilisin/kexin/sedolisin [Penicillium cf. griseofulvum]